MANEGAWKMETEERPEQSQELVDAAALLATEIAFFERERAALHAAAMPTGIPDAPVILGRDLLNLAVFVYDGINGRFSLTTPD